ncbi:hypothetical protein F5Y16DRAFT_396145 [Xylariaceae sp. FL0255]|nr:hypothetical protein F5Y16DRAFT_396145 [Xylariaceae sp. FL0255]
MTVKQAVGATFDAHVMSGYRLLTQYYDRMGGDYDEMDPKRCQNPHIRIQSRSDHCKAKLLERFANTISLLCTRNGGHGAVRPFTNTKEESLNRSWGNNESIMLPVTLFKSIGHKQSESEQ